MCCSGRSVQPACLTIFDRAFLAVEVKRLFRCILLDLVTLRHNTWLRIPRLYVAHKLEEHRDPWDDIEAVQGRILVAHVPRCDTVRDAQEVPQYDPYVHDKYNVEPLPLPFRGKGAAEEVCPNPKRHGVHFFLFFFGNWIKILKSSSYSFAENKKEAKKLENCFFRKLKGSRWTKVRGARGLSHRRHHHSKQFSSVKKDIRICTHTHA